MNETKPTQQLHELGQSLWIDNITRTMLDDGTLAGYVEDLSVTGLTSNPTIFDKAIGGGDSYDEQISELQEQGLTGEDLFFELALADLRRAAEIFQPINERTDDVDGWVSLEVSPLLADDTEATIKQAADLHSRAAGNFFIKIPGTPAGLPAIEDTIYAGIPVNVTLLFDREQYLAAADAYAKGLERRLQDGLSLTVPSVASVFLSRWDVAVADEVGDELKNRLGIAIGKDCYAAYREFSGSDRIRRLINSGARQQRLLFASTGTKDPNAPDTMYIDALAAPHTVNTMPEPTLLAYADHGAVGEPLAPDGGDAAEELGKFSDVGIDLGALAARLQDEGKEAFNKSWNDMIGSLESKREAVAAG